MTNELIRSAGVRRLLVTVLLVSSGTAAEMAHGADAPKPPDLVAPTGPLSPQEEQKKFHLPPGFKIELVASEPQIAKPINMNFDAAGRLFVTSSFEYPFPAKQNPRDAILVIDDTNGDGLPDRVRTFADGLNIPIGVLPVTDGVIGHSIPNVYKFRDTDGDGKADKREILLTGFGFVDTHGMASSFTWGLDGWIYACHGFANRSEIKGTDGSTIKLHSGNTFRFRPDGTHVEQFTHGQVNPFGLTFDDLGNLYSSDCHSRPIYQLIHGAYYPSFGKPHDGLGYGPELMTHQHGSTGICGVSFYGANNFPPEYRGTLFVCNPVTGRINHDWMSVYGSTYKAIERPDFLSCDDPWFRPVDSKLGPDGALYVADFYNSIIGHYEVPLTHPRRDRTRGRIWRITYKGTAGQTHQPAPNLSKQTNPELIASLDHSNHLIRSLATHELIGRGRADAARVLLQRGTDRESPLTDRQRSHAVWVLSALKASQSNLFPFATRDGAGDVLRVQRAKVLGEQSGWTDITESSTTLRAMALAALNDDAPFVRRAAAEVLDRYPNQAHLSPLLELWRRTPAEDLFLIHTTRIALRENLLPLPDLAASFKQFSPDDRDRLAEVALAIPNAKAADWVIEHLQSKAADATLPVESARFLMRHASDGALARLFDLIERRSQRATIEQEAGILASLARGIRERGKTFPDRFRPRAIVVAEKLLKRSDVPGAMAGLDLARDAKLLETFPSLEGVLQNPKFEYAPLKRMVVDSLVELNGEQALPILARRLRDSHEKTQVRTKAAEGLGSINSAASHNELIEAFRTAPEDLALGMARALTVSRTGALALLEAVTQGKTSPRHLQDVLVSTRLRGYPIPGLEERLAELTRSLPPEDERPKKLIASRQAAFLKRGGNPLEGAKVFTRTCAACHRIGNTGGKVGPELDGVGVRGLARLLEDTLTPNRNVDQAFRTTSIVLKNGRIQNGLFLRNEGAVLVLADDQGKEVRVAEADVEERSIIPLSPMPANIAEQLPEKDFYDLMAHLLSQQAPATRSKP